MIVSDIRKLIHRKAGDTEIFLEIKEGKYIELDPEGRSEYPEPPSMWDEPKEILILKTKEE
ncbi:MAG: hypothetical protein LIO77_08485 [Rikenellaceae bacterium]|nr:hypothetical protein [Rikenellaceae bacterium]